MVFGYLVLDACRDNPFATAWLKTRAVVRRRITRALQIERSQGMLIAYSTQPNAVAATAPGAQPFHRRTGARNAGSGT